MRIIKYVILLATIISLSINCFTFADEEEIREKYKDYRRPKAPVQAGAVKDRFKMKFSLGVVEGFDNNVFLDPSREEDFYDQCLSSLDIRYKLSDSLNVKVAYDSTSITYHEYTDLSMLDNDIALFLEYFPDKNARVRAGYDVDFINYLKNENGDFYTQGPFADIRYFVSEKSYIGGGYEYKIYDYDKRKIRNGANRTVDTTREDHRHNIIAEFGTYIGKVFLKIKNTFYFNESNDGYMDYYDYRSDKISGYITYPFFNERAYLLLSGGYQRKDYKSRQITTSSSKEYDNLMILGGGLYYKILPNLYINGNYTYRQNYSNDPIQEYSGSTSSIGLQWFF